jgi:hypothetical protein
LCLCLWLQSGNTMSHIVHTQHIENGTGSEVSTWRRPTYETIFENGQNLHVFAENLNAAKCLEEPTGETHTHKLRF